MTVKELAAVANRPSSRLLAALNSGILNSGKASLGSKLEDHRLLVELVKLMGLRPVFKTNPVATVITDRDAHPRPPACPADCVPRPPVVAVLGHVDHGKTTLLDAFRASRMVDGEFGGITQHIAAFTVSLSSVAVQAGVADLADSLSDILSDHITFVDTPGHAAFSAIRARGAAATDIMVLVVAADDGVMPQTVESIRFAKEQNTPIVVAINKIDKKEADVACVIEELALHGVVVEQLGGEIQSVEISALKRINLHRLLEAICLQAELMQIRADPTGPAEAVVLESKLEHGIGKVATCLVTRGQLQKTPASGPLVASEAICSPRMILNDRGERITSVSPGYVAKVAGWKDLPPAGSLVLELTSMSEATEVIRFRRNIRMQKKAEEDHSAYLDKMAPYQEQYNEFLRERAKSPRVMWRKLSANRPDFQSVIQATQSGVPVLPLLIKTDVHGSLEAIRTILSTCPSDECVLEFGQSGVGPLTESEVETAEALDATVLLFNVTPLPRAVQLAESLHVSVRQHNIIYRLAEDVREMVNQLLPSSFVEKVVGEAEILQLFEVKESRGGGSKPLRIPVAGCRCTKGVLLAGGQGAPKLPPDQALLGEVVAVHYRLIRPTRSSSNVNEDHSDGDEAGTVLVSRAICRSLRHERTAVDSIRKGVECGLALTDPEISAGSSKGKLRVLDPSENFISNWQVGDVVQCYVLLREHRKSRWEFETKTSSTHDS
ncbi:hypothetical protein T265_11007 [Opisthorchis viverrini]|uniref:Tr-type G domain-containing protein n=1 Tax=Opisthorchis viverrini TaxID=6198 RepID=A0A074ZB37_OPIVI|nr:hypothetical protein T265_11007 [Opisthorchis viverrini]KER20445.1 hypothetical protein T265_11007 [Opisthorchis viverrini]